VLSGDLNSSTEVVCQLLEETIQTVANGGMTFAGATSPFPRLAPHALRA